MAPNCVLLLAILFIILPFSATAQTYRNVSLGRSLTASSQNTPWLSPSGDFAFGFRPLDSNQTQFLLAIWFDKTSNKTVSWYLKDVVDPVQTGFTIELTADGWLSLKDQTGNAVWSVGGQAAYAAMLNTGNFVLVGSDGSTKWESFSMPADTILPGQVLRFVQDIALRAKLMDDDYSRGRFILRMQSDGNLVMYYAEPLTGTQYAPYYASNTVGNGTEFVFDQSGGIYFSLKSGGPFTVFPDRGSSTGNAYQRATLDPDGAFRQYVYNKSGTSWEVVNSLPEDMCQMGMTSTGSGICGFNSYCISADKRQRVDCRCPEHYVFIDATRKYKGCEPDFTPQNCDSDGSDFDFVPMINVDWSGGDYDKYISKTEAECRQQCLKDCFCAVAIYGNENSCWMKRAPLSNGHMANGLGVKALIKFSRVNNSWLHQGNSSESLNTSRKWKDKKIWIIAGTTLLVSSVFIILLLVVVIVMIRFSSFGLKNKRPVSAKSMSSVSLQAFTYKELEEATNGFTEEVGRGAFGIVYKGFVQEHRRICVAVKKLHMQLQQDTEKEFANEVKSIGQTYHKNLVKLLGYCNEGQERLLVYEFMSNSSLTDYLFNGERPTWNHRIQIALDVARGLSYLHEELRTPIIHCDIKPENVLLDDNFVARISDFGLSKLLRTDQSRTSTTGIRGTKGYVAPEWFKNTRVTAKVDVYSFGVLLLEIICCRKNIKKEAELDDVDQMILTFWAYDCYRDQKLDLLVQNDEEVMLDMDSFEKFVNVALWCIQDDPSSRPSMQKVAQMLEGTISIPPPPDPSGNASFTN